MPVAEVEGGRGGVAEGADVHGGVGVAHHVRVLVAAPREAGWREPRLLPFREERRPGDDGAVRRAAAAPALRPAPPPAQPGDGVSLQLDDPGLHAVRVSLGARDAQDGAVEVQVLPRGSLGLDRANAGEEAEREAHPGRGAVVAGVGLGHPENALDLVWREPGGLAELHGAGLERRDERQVAETLAVAPADGRDDVREKAVPRAGRPERLERAQDVLPAERRDGHRRPERAAHRAGHPAHVAARGRLLLAVAGEEAVEELAQGERRTAGGLRRVAPPRERQLREGRVAVRLVQERQSVERVEQPAPPEKRRDGRSDPLLQLRKRQPFRAPTP